MNSEIDVNERIDTFLENKTYVFIKLISGKLLNGFILSKLTEDTIKFKDDQLGDIPILVREIGIIDYSNKKRSVAP